jgi:phenylpyruvate tautomerase PptA (4-oxalocrotonate tautomerase family)
MRLQLDGADICHGVIGMAVKNYGNKKRAVSVTFPEIRVQLYGVKQERICVLFA